MRSKWTICVLALAAAAGGALGASAVLGGTDPAPTVLAEANEVTVDVATPAAARKAKTGTKIVYPSGPPQVVPNSDDVTSNITVSSCPSGTKVVNGQVDTSHQLIIVEASHAVGKREWLFRLTDADGGGGTADAPTSEPFPGDFTGTFGLVCAPNPK